MPTKDLIQRSDNTRVDVGTKELPRWVSPSTLDKRRATRNWIGQLDRAKGNYLTSAAQDYTKNTSGQVESVSPEFDFLGGLGISWLSKKAISKFSPKTVHKLGKVISDSSKDTDVAPFTFHLKRLKAGSYKNIDNTNKIKDIKTDYRAFDVSNEKDLNEISRILGTDNKSFLDWYNKPDNYGVEFISNGKNRNVIVYNSLDEKHVKELPYAISHEYNHLLHSASGYTIKEAPDLRSYEEFLEYCTKVHPKWRVSDVKRVYNYFTEKGFTEVSSRGTQVKDFLKKVDDSAITPEEFIKASEEYITKTGMNNNMDDFFFLISKNPNYNAKWLSKYSSGLIPPVLMFSNGMNNE